MASQDTDATAGSNADPDLAEGTDPADDEVVDELAERLAGYVDRNELSRIQQNIARQLGQVGTVQRELSKVERAHAGTVESVTAMRELLTVAVQALLSQLPEGSSERQQVAGLLDSHRSQAQVAKIIADKFGDLSDDDDADDDAEQIEPAWQAANAAVEAYAEGKGVDPAAISNADYQRIQDAVEASGGGPRDAVAAMKKLIDTLAARQERRADRRDAATQAPPRGGKVTGGRGLTVESMKAMTVAEVMAIPKAERIAALNR